MDKELCTILSDKREYIVLVYMVLEYWMGKTRLIKSGSLLELIFRFIFRKPIEVSTTQEKVMNLGKDVSVEYKDGKAIISALNGAVELQIKAGVVVNPILDKVSAQIESGEIDLIKGTDLEKGPLLQAIAYIKEQLNK